MNPQKPKNQKGSCAPKKVEESRFNFYLANNSTAKKGCSYFKETANPIRLIEML